MTNTSVLLVGPVPPPLHGCALSFTKIAEHLSNGNIDITVVDTSSKSLVKNFKYYLTKTNNGLAVILSPFLYTFSSAYIAIDSGYGSIFTLPLILYAKLSKTNLVIHHHSFKYINKFSHLINISHILSSSNTHIFLCHEMEEKYTKQYGKVSNSHIVPNYYCVRNRKPKPSHRREKVVVGHMANLCAEKGLDTFIDLIALVYEVGLENKIEFVIAGPCVDASASQLISTAAKAYGGLLNYLGPVYDTHKDKFFDSIDIFVFPTRYLDEAQPVVLIEAAASGNVLFSTRRGGLASLVNNLRGHTFASETFVKDTFETLNFYVKNRNTLEEQKISSKTAYLEHSRKSHLDLNSVLKILSAR